jgi:hypothetical protein
MKDFDRHASFPANTDRLVDGFHFLGAFAAHMGGVNTAERSRYFAKSDQLLGFGVVARRVDQCSRDAESAVFHGLFDEGSHLVEFGGCWSPVIVANHRLTDLGGSYKGAQVERGALLFETLEISIQGRPIDCQVIVIEERLQRSDGFFILWRDGIAFAGYFRSDALRQLAESPVVDEERHLGLAQHINEPGSDNLSRGIDYLRRSRVTQISDDLDLIAAYADVGGIPWIATATENVPILNENVE